MSRNSAPLDESAHVAWFARALQDPQRSLLIAETAYGTFAMVRFDVLVPPEWEISIVLAPEARGQGLGRSALAAAVDYFFKLHADGRVLASVKNDNTISQRLFLSQGFKESSCQNDMKTYSLIRQQR